MIAQEDGPLAVFGDVGRLVDDLDDRMAILLRDRHVHARHQREVVRHVAFVAIREIVAHVFRPHVRLGEQHAIGIIVIDHFADPLNEGVRLGQILIARALALHEVRNRV